MRYFAERHNRKAIEMEGSGDRSGAILCYQRAISADKQWSVPWYNLGLLYKRERNWSGSFDSNLRAVELDPTDEDAWWNLGIAATALENWPEARRAWIACGIPLDDEEGPIDLNFGPTPVRLNSDDNGEVVWCDRIDPSRAIIRNIPLPESGHNYGDLLLHDGEPQGYRVLDGIEIPVFNELQLLRRGEFTTFLIQLSGLEEFENEELIQELGESQIPAEDWSSSVRTACRACSLGRPAEADHTHQGAPKGHLHIGLAATSEDSVRQFLNAWIASRPEVEVIEFVSFKIPE